SGPRSFVFATQESSPSVAGRPSYSKMVPRGPTSAILESLSAPSLPDCCTRSQGSISSPALARCDRPVVVAPCTRLPASGTRCADFDSCLKFRESLIVVQLCSRIGTYPDEHGPLDSLVLPFAIGVCECRCNNAIVSSHSAPPFSLPGGKW